MEITEHVQVGARRVAVRVGGNAGADRTVLLLHPAPGRGCEASHLDRGGGGRGTDRGRHGGRVRGSGATRSRRRG
jgi:hypothetical protein